MRVPTFPAYGVVIDQDTAYVCGAGHAYQHPTSGAVPGWRALLSLVADLAETARTPDYLSGQHGRTVHETTVVLRRGAVPDDTGMDVLRADGWTVTPFGSSRWTRVQRLDTVVWVCADDADGGSMWDESTPSDVIASRLAWYRRTVGVAYRCTPGASGVAAMRLYGGRCLRPRAAVPRWRWDDADAEMVAAGELRRTRPATIADRELHVRAFDIRAMYLAAAAGARLGLGVPELDHAPAYEWQPPASSAPVVYYAGLYRIDAGVPLGAGIVIPAPRVREDGTAWVTTPVIEYIHERGESVYVHESWTSLAQTTVLRPWAEQVRDGIAGHAGGAGAGVLKASYAEAIGLLARPGGLVYRPDWRATIVDLARMNMLRKLDRVAASTGRTPLRIDTDCVWFAAPVADLMPGGGVYQALVENGIGKFRPVGDAVPFADIAGALRLVDVLWESPV